jgi:hypothetical protein
MYQLRMDHHQGGDAMSRASQWAAEYERIKGAVPPPLDVDPRNHDRVTAYVRDGGRVAVFVGSNHLEFDGPAAAALGRWLLDTFGEPPDQQAGQPERPAVGQGQYTR